MRKGASPHAHRGVDGGGMVEDRERCARAGMAGCVSKPVSSTAIVAVLARWVGETGRGIQY